MTQADLAASKAYAIDASRATVAVVGMGRMGRAMAERLRAQGIDVVVWNRTGSVADEVAARIGARVVGTAREAAAAADIVVQSLADDSAVLATASSSVGVLAGLRAGSLLIDTSTVDPATIAKLAPQVAAVGAELLDAPVSGSVPSVLAGTLMIMVGGRSDTLDRARGVLEHLGDRIFHLGPSGAGSAMKLAVNGAVHALNIGLSEALVMAERCDVDRATAWDVLMASAAGAPFVAYKRNAFVDPAATPPAFTLALVEKDLRLIATLAERVGVEAAQVRANHAIASAATADGHGDRDMSWLAQLLREAP